MMNKLLALYARNRHVAGRGFQVRAAQEDEATVYLYDAIVADQMEAEWWGGVDPLSFARTLSAITAPVVHLRVNSPGGSVFAARAMEQVLREHPARIIAHVDGLAASAASFLILAADEVEIASGALIMIHKGWALTMGNADDHRAMTALLDKLDGTLADTYAAETGQERARILEWMTAETWFTAQEAVDHGFADRIAVEPGADTQALAWDLSVYGQRMAEEATPAPNPACASADHRARHAQRMAVLDRAAPR